MPSDEEARALRVKEAHELELMEVPGVGGVGPTRNEIGGPPIAVYVRERAVGERLASTLGGGPIVICVSGEIDAQ